MRQLVKVGGVESTRMTSDEVRPHVADVKDRRKGM